LAVNSKIGPNFKKKLIKKRNTTSPKSIVLKAPPINPSQVFFGEILINGVLPKKNPNI